MCPGSRTLPARLSGTSVFAGRPGQWCGLLSLTPSPLRSMLQLEARGGGGNGECANSDSNPSHEDSFLLVVSVTIKQVT